MGVTAHCFDGKSHQHLSAMLGIRSIRGSHTACLVFVTIKDILATWDLQEAKVSRIVIDNGSNMVTVFQSAFDWVNFQDNEFGEDGSPLAVPEENGDFNSMALGDESQQAVFFHV